MLSLPAVLVVAGLMFGIGLYGVLGQTNAIMVIMGVELMLGATMLNVIGFLRLGERRERERHHDRHEDARDAVGEALHGRLAGLRLGDEAGNLR